MTNTKKRTERSSIFPDPGRMAPSVDKQWRDDFMVELRLLDVPGSKIGDHLMTVETHVAESGESAQEAFGDARTYARELAPDADDKGWLLSPLSIAGNIVGLLGIYLTLWAFGSWLDGEPASILVGTIVSVAMLLVLLMAVMWLFGPLVRLINDHGVLSFLLFMAAGGLVGVPVLVLRQPLFEVAPVVLGVIGIALLLVSSVVSYREGMEEQDEITAPGETPQRSRAVRIIAPLALPAATLLGALILWIPTLFT